MTTQSKIRHLLDRIYDSIEHWPTLDTNVQEYALKIWSAHVLPHKTHDALLAKMKVDFWGLVYPILYAHKALVEPQISIEDKMLWRNLIKDSSPEYAIRAMEWVLHKAPNMETHQIFATMIRDSDKWKSNSSIISGKGFKEYCQDYIAFGEFIVAIGNNKTKEGKPWSKDFITWTTKQTDLYSDSVSAEAPKYLPSLLSKSTLPVVWQLRLYKHLAPKFWVEDNVSSYIKPLLQGHEHLIQRLDTLPWSSYSELNKKLVALYLPEVYEFISVALSENDWLLKNNVKNYTELFAKKSRAIIATDSIGYGSAFQNLN